MRKSEKRISPVAQAVAVFGRILAITFLALLVLLILAPVVWMFLSAFRPPDQIVEYPPRFFPKNYVVQNFKDVYKMIPVNKYILNSFIFSGTVTLGSTLLNSMAGYAFARMQFKGKNVLFMMFMASMMIPFQVIMIPLFMIVFYMGMLDTYRGLIIPQLAGVGGIFFLRSFFITLPAQLEEAGRLDGLTEFGIFFRIMLPLCKTALMTQAVLSFSGCWNNLLWPLLITSSNDRRMLANGIMYFVGQNTVNYGPAFAAGVISVFPLLVLFIFGQKYFVNSIVSSGIKG